MLAGETREGNEGEWSLFCVKGDGAEREEMRKLYDTSPAREPEEKLPQIGRNSRYIGKAEDGEPAVSGLCTRRRLSLGEF